MALIASTRLRFGSIRDAAALLDGYDWNPRGRLAYDGSVIIAVQDLNRATSALKGKDKVQVTCSQLFTGKTTQSIIAAIDAVASMYLSLANLPNANIKNHSALLKARNGVKMAPDKNYTLVIQDLSEEQKILKLARMLHQVYPDLAEAILGKDFTTYNQAKDYASRASDHKFMLKRAPNRNPRSTTYANALTDMVEETKHDSAKPKSKSTPRPKTKPTTSKAAQMPCRNWTRSGSCSYGDNCKFKHDGKPGTGALVRKIQRHPPVDAAKFDDWKAKQPAEFINLLEKMHGHNLKSEENDGDAGNAFAIFNDDQDGNTIDLPSFSINLMGTYRLCVPKVRFSKDNKGQQTIQAVLDTACEVSVADSGMIEDIFFGTKCIIDYAPLTNPRSVKAANGSMIPVIGSCTLLLWISTKQQVNIPVLIVGKLDAGLLISLSQLVKWGAVMDLGNKSVLFKQVEIGYGARRGKNCIPKY